MDREIEMDEEVKRLGGWGGLWAEKASVAWVRMKDGWI